MITYVYETIPPAESGEEVRQFEYSQPIGAEPLKHDPDTGYPVKRVVTGGLGVLLRNGGGGEGGCCGGWCGCHP